MVALAVAAGGARADEAAAARLLRECRALATVLMGSVTETRAALDELVLMGTEGGPRQRLALHDALQRALVRSEMAASALVRLHCPNRGIVAEFDADLQRAWQAMAANRQNVLRALPGP